MCFKQKEDDLDIQQADKEFFFFKYNKWGIEFEPPTKEVITCQLPPRYMITLAKEEELI